MQPTERLSCLAKELARESMGLYNIPHWNMSILGHVPIKIHLASELMC